MQNSQTFHITAIRHSNGTATIRSSTTYGADMINRTPVIKLLFGSAFVSICLLVLFVKIVGSTDGHYEPGQTYEYHPPATHELDQTERAINELDDPDRKAEVLFVPTFEDGASVALEARLSHRAVKAGDDVTVHAAVAVKARELSEIVGGVAAADEQRSGLNIALVIDRSGSMTGMKLDFAKSASRALIDYLGPRDRLAIVSYGSDVTTLSESLPVTAENRDRLHRAIASIDCHGGTNLSGGFLRGRELVEKAKGGDRINRVLLLSDGQANEGIVAESELSRIASTTLENGTSVTTMGMGLDYNEDLLQEMSRAGAGNYYFIDDASATEEVFAAELHGLKSIVASSVELSLSAPHGEIVNVSGVEFRRRGEAVIIDLDTLAGGVQKDLLAEVRLDDGGIGTREALVARLVYTDVATERGVVLNERATVSVTNGAVQTDPLVIRRLLHIRTARAFDEAMEYYDAGDRFTAADLVDRRRRENREFVKENGLVDPQVDQIDRAFERLAESLRKTERHSTKGKWISKRTKFNSANASVTSQVIF